MSDTLTDKIVTAVEAYFTGFNTQNADMVTGIYADNATLEDPVGTPIRSGIDAIKEFYKGPVEGGTKLTRNSEIRVAANCAAFEFTVDVAMPEGRMSINVIDVMEFNEEGKVTSMKAYWGETNVRMG